MKPSVPALTLAALLIFGIQNSVLAATCSCAGVPLLTSLDVSATEKGQFFLNYTTEFHQMSDLVAGHADVNDETGRDRSSFSQVISASYALTDRWSVSGLISHIEHNREIGASFFDDKTTTSGFGDSVILVRYTPLFITPFSRHELSVGLGARIATGDDDLILDNGFVVSEDMQPSIGANGGIFWSSYGYAFNQAATVQLNVSANYTVNGENDREYSFGSEFNFALGLSQSIGTKFGYSAVVRYRTTRADERFGSYIPNTGGQWVDFVPALQYAVTDRLNIGLHGRIPVTRDLKGTLQFTTSYAYSLSLTYGF